MDFLDFLVLKLYLGVKKMCKKFREIPTVGLDLAREPNLLLDSPKVQWCYTHLFNSKTTWTS